MTLTDLASIFDVDELPVHVVAGAPTPLLFSARQSGPNAGLDPATARTVMAELRARAAILIRALGPVDAQSTAALADLIFADEPTFATGEHPQAEGSETLYRPVSFAPDETLLWHHENSFNATWPRFIMFACATPASEGGGTSIADSRLVYAQMAPTVTAALAEHDVRYERVCNGRTGRRWEQIYGTTERTEARRLANAQGEELLFTGNDASIRATRPAFQAVAHGTSWFNQILHWHPQALPHELRAMVAAGLLPALRNCHLGNGDEIPPEVVDQLIGTHRAIEFTVDWQPGDILLLDNTVFAHGRHPYRGSRAHFVRMAGVGSIPPAATTEAGSST